MRYEVNEYYPFLFFHGKYHYMEEKNNQFIMSYTGKNLIEKIELKVLKCIEHHKVNGEYDEKGAEPKYDGFVFLDKEGNHWHNQYPIASYGQTSDGGDSIVEISNENFREGYDESNLPCYGFCLRRQYSSLKRAKIDDLSEEGKEFLQELNDIIEKNNFTVEMDYMIKNDGTKYSFISKILVPDSMKW